MARSQVGQEVARGNKPYPKAVWNEFNKWKHMCKVKKDRWKEGMCWLLAAV